MRAGRAAAGRPGDLSPGTVSFRLRCAILLPDVELYSSVPEHTTYCRATEGPSSPTVAPYHKTRSLWWLFKAITGALQPSRLQTWRPAPSLWQVTPPFCGLFCTTAMLQHLLFMVWLCGARRAHQHRPKSNILPHLRTNTLMLVVFKCS